ncbi:trypsin-like serine peptidase [Brevundimonas goettingensis]|uniref:Trypsin-like peptidase domain-containing protein n=1 Tax=Brevundimonas goettingensis TaxID=2774190 RepID=A0A975GX77_9CAUL|nr:serine protease [Brevundimonas goettingensis]QTC92648.1 trypsin-like peptidase domain-containing protein [Brevundimonas goettingensis]
MLAYQTPPAVEAPAPPQAPAAVARHWDLTVGLINATVQLDQPTGAETRTVGTGFLIDAPKPDGTPRIVMVTAGHVLEKMPDPDMRVGWRIAQADGSWKFDPQPLEIRNEAGTPLWTTLEGRDVAVMAVEVPETFARAAIPLAWLADAETFDALDVGPGDELLALGFPRGLSSNRAGFPILRVGRVASYPLTPVSAFPTFLMDFTVFPGNSGGPIFWTPTARRRPGATEPEHPFIAGMLSQEVIVGTERLELGVVVQAQYIREAIALLDRAP